MISENPHAIVFEDKDIDASIDLLCWLACFPLFCGAIPYKTELHLGNEEITKIDVSMYGKSVSKRPYGELGSVDRTSCCCCVSVESAFGPISPGCGCEHEQVDELVEELKARQRGRGDTAQIQKAEQQLQKLDEIDTKLNIIMEHLKIPQPMDMSR